MCVISTVLQVDGAQTMTAQSPGDVMKIFAKGMKSLFLHTIFFLYF